MNFVYRKEKNLTLVVCFLLPLKREIKKTSDACSHFLRLQTSSLPACYSEALELTQLSAFQQALKKLQEVTPDPASGSNMPLFEPGTEVLIKTLGSGG